MEVISNKESFVWNLHIPKSRRRDPPYINPQFSAKIILPNGYCYVSSSSPFYSDYCTKSLFISVSSDFYEKYIVTQDYCVSTHNSLCSLENCKFYFVLIGISLSQFFQRLDKYVYIYIYQEIECLYTLFKHRFYSSIVTSSGEVFNQLRRAVQHNLRWRGAEKMPSIAKKRLIRKKIQETLFMFQPETGFHTNSWFSVSGKNSKNSKLKKWTWFNQDYWLLYWLSWFCGSVIK